MQQKLLPCLSLGLCLAFSALQPVAAEETPSSLSVNPNWEKTIVAFSPKVDFPDLGASSRYLPEENNKRLVVNLSQRRVLVYEEDKVISSYPIAVGKPGWETPAGSYHVFLKELNPVFKSFKSGRIVKPGPDNPLGVRWIGFWTNGKTQLGFHGTNEPELIGQAVSHGCIRMHNRDVMAMYEQVSIGTPVTVKR
jgi:L,D-transpeptidase ErfK/SrfK